MNDIKFILDLSSKAHNRETEVIFKNKNKLGWV